MPSIVRLTVTSGTRRYIPALTVINKVDGVSMETLDRLAREGDGRTLMISCELDLGLDWLLESIWQVSSSGFRQQSSTDP